MRAALTVMMAAGLTALSAPAQACENPPAQAGVIIFNSDHKVMQYCNGDQWIGLWGGGGGGGGSGIPSCDNGEVPKWNNDEWTCGSDADTLAGLNCSPDQIAKFDGSAWICSASLSEPPTCNEDNNALQWNGNSWMCVNINSAPEYDLVGGLHSSDQCTDAGGVVFVSGENSFCRVTGASCPLGWNRYLNWGSYTSASCGSPWSCSTCNTGARAWGNNPAPTCTYSQQLNPEGGCTFGLVCTGNPSEVGCY